MLSFLFAALAAVLDQLFKRWSTIALVEQTKNVICEVTGTAPCNCGIELIPGIIRLRFLENDGALFGFMSGQRWILVGVMFAAILVLIFILLRYNEGFWGTLGLSAVLGGAVGNFIDRLFRGSVIDMFEFEFVRFAVFNIADIFITMGALMVIVSFFIYTFKSDEPKAKKVKAGKAASEDIDDLHSYEQSINDAAQYERNVNQVARYEQPDEIRAVIEPDDNTAAVRKNELSIEDEFATVQSGDSSATVSGGDSAVDTGLDSSGNVFESGSTEEDSSELTEPEPQPDASELIEGLESLELDLTHEEILGDDDMDELLRGYGFESDNNKL